MSRVAVYIDGFNLYHSLLEAAKISPQGNRLKWLNLRKLVENQLSPSKRIVQIKYFTALFPDPQKERRHKKYLSVLKDTGIEVVYGKFKVRDKKCRICRRFYKTHEEKRTDVNIAVHILRDAFTNLFDTAILISGDTDITPALELTKAETGKRLTVYMPYNRKNRELSRVADSVYRISVADLEAALFHQSHIARDGRRLTMPPEWTH